MLTDSSQKPGSMSEGEKGEAPQTANTAGEQANQGAPPTAATSKTFVKDVQDKENVHSVFLVKDKALLSGKNGKSYISMFLCDRTGALDSRVWDNVDTLNQVFQSGDLIRAKGQVQIFQNRKQLVIHRLEKIASDGVQMSDFISTSTKSPEEMFQRLMQIATEMTDSNLRQLTLDTLGDPEIRSRLLAAPAAKTIHHAYYGGLLEHILSICGIMKLLAQHYADHELRVDLLIFGAIFHDIGKIWELEIDSGISYTDKGKLLGHMMMAVELVEKKTQRILGFPEELKDLCKHIILSHHGKVEYGSPKVPMFLEAFIVAAIDDLDSKINTIRKFVESERESGDRWSKYNQLFERYFLLKI